jgi:hypothetical protein
MFSQEQFYSRFPRSVGQVVDGRRYLERKPCAHFIREHFCNNTIKRGENLHGELGLNPAFVDQVIERIGKGETETG